MNKRYYRMNTIDFYKWLKRVKPALELAKYYTHRSDEYRRRMLSSYKESIIIKKQYELLRNSLDENGLITLEKLLNKEPINNGLKLSPYFCDVYGNWCAILFPNNTAQIETFDRKDIAVELTKLRIERGYNREEVSGLIKIHPVSLKEYEDGKRLIPIDKLYSILQIYDVGFDEFIRNVKKSKIYY